jgi:hypothetical protein
MHNYQWSKRVYLIPAKRLSLFRHSLTYHEINGQRLLCQEKKDFFWEGETRAEMAWAARVELKKVARKGERNLG